MHEPQPITVTVAQTRKLSGLGSTKLWELIANGQLETVRVGRRRLVVFRSLETLLRPDTTPDPRRRGRPRKAETSDASAVSTSEPHA